MFDTAGVLDRSFTPVEEGYLFYPSRWSHGYLVKPEEYGELIDEWRRVAGWKGLLSLIGLMVVALLIGMAIIYWLGLAEWANTVISLGLATGLAGYLIWKSTAANRLVRNRTPAAPPRAARAADHAMGKALGRPMAMWLAILSLIALGWAIAFAMVTPLWGIPAAIVFGIMAFFNLRIAVRAFRP